MNKAPLRLRGVLALLGVLQGRCDASATPTELIVVVDAEKPLADEIDRVDMQLAARDGSDPFVEHTFLVTQGQATDKRFPLPLSFVVEPRDVLARFRLHIAGFDGTTKLAEQAVITGFRPGHQSVLRIVLYEACREVFCEPDQSCFDRAKCEAVPEVVDTLPDLPEEEGAEFEVEPVDTWIDRMGDQDGGADGGNTGFGDAALDGGNTGTEDGGSSDAETDSAATADAGEDFDCQTGSDCGGQSCMVTGECCSPSRVCGATCCPEGRTCWGGTCVSSQAGVCSDDSDCDPEDFCALAAPPASTGVCRPRGPSMDSCRFEPGDVAQPKWHWGEENVREVVDKTAVAAPPLIARIWDENGDGRVDESDTPMVLVISGEYGELSCTSGDAPTGCRGGVLRALHGRTGVEVWSLEGMDDSATGFANIAPAVAARLPGEIPHIYAVTTELTVGRIQGDGVPLQESEDALSYGGSQVGWGGALTVGRMDGDTSLEILFGGDLFTDDGLTIVRRWTAPLNGGPTAFAGFGSMADLVGDDDSEALIGPGVYRRDGMEVWRREDLPDGPSIAADLNGDGTPEVVYAGGNLQILSPTTGDTIGEPLDTDTVAAPLVADLDGTSDGRLEIASLTRADDTNQSWLSVFTVTSDLQLGRSWSRPVHEFSSQHIPLVAFDFDDDGANEIILVDECFLWVFDGATGNIRFTSLRAAYATTEVAAVGDIDGDGRADLVYGSTGAGAALCSESPWYTGEDYEVPQWHPDENDNRQRGVYALEGVGNAWANAPSLFHQHLFHRTSICLGGDPWCSSDEGYGVVPREPATPWSIPWTQGPRTQVSEHPRASADASVSLRVGCEETPTVVATVRNEGAIPLPAGVEVDLHQVVAGEDDVRLSQWRTPRALRPGESLELTHSLSDPVNEEATFYARVVHAHETDDCRANNDRSEMTGPSCVP